MVEFTQKDAMLSNLAEVFRITRSEGPVGHEGISIITEWFRSLNYQFVVLRHVSRTVARNRVKHIFRIVSLVEAPAETVSPQINNFERLHTLLIEAGKLNPSSSIHQAVLTVTYDAPTE